MFGPNSISNPPSSTIVRRILESSVGTLEARMLDSALCTHMGESVVLTCTREVMVGHLILVQALVTIKGQVAQTR